MSTLSHFWRDPALPYVESRRACHSRACYRPHSHPTYSIGAVDGGSSVFTGAARGAVALQPGLLVFVPAQRVHACNPEVGQAWSYQMLHLDDAWLQAVRRESVSGAEDETPDAEPVRIVAEPLAYERFCRLNELLFSAADATHKEAALIEFIGDSGLVSQSSALTIPGRAQASPAAAIRPVQDWLHAAPEASPALTELARLAGMSRYQLIRAFRAATGLTPHAWHLNLRVNLARDRLRLGADLAELALHLGFADQAHFQRVFKAHTGITPGRFRG